MSDRHKTPRVFASGSQKRKLQAERVKKSEESLAKTPKLTSFFTSLNKEEISQDPKKTTEDSTVNIDVDNIQDNPEGPEAEVSSGDTTQFSITESQTQKEVELSEESSGLKNDIGLWPVNITKEMIDNWANKGSTELQNCDQVSLQNSVPQDQPRDTSNFVRKCTKNMFTRRNKNQETVNRFWLCFSPTTGKIYCYACKLMST